MSVAADVSDWIATPAPFSGNKCGKNAVLSSDNSIVQRRPYPDVDVGDCVCYTVHPLPPGQVWQTTVLETTTGWRDGLSVGVTATLPDVVPSYLLSYGSGHHEWNYGGITLWRNGRELSSGLPDLSILKPHQGVGLLLTASGDLHVFFDGRHVKKVASGLPVNDHLWGAVNVYGNCTKIKSELLSGELDGTVGPG
ncbi:Neuralized-like protein 4 [Geodia barretti]|uniref:Neuralized-like protein 4 n=1 Tax=Geodia barretti TaxID=519541 RepID=A0AA35TBZ9_GEOBA|nr:Neuralized-like protein 4 [Geodia barretti]